MAREGLSPDTLLGVKLSGILARNQYTSNPDAVIDELYAAAGDRLDILAMETGTWAGFHEADEHMQTLARALWEIPGVGPWIKVGRERRNAGRHAAN